MPVCMVGPGENRFTVVPHGVLEVVESGGMGEQICGGGMPVADGDLDVLVFPGELGTAVVAAIEGAIVKGEDGEEGVGVMAQNVLDFERDGLAVAVFRRGLEAQCPAQTMLTICKTCCDLILLAICRGHRNICSACGDHIYPSARKVAFPKGRNDLYGTGRSLTVGELLYGPGTISGTY